MFREINLFFGICVVYTKTTIYFSVVKSGEWLLTIINAFKFGLFQNV